MSAAVERANLNLLNEFYGILEQILRLGDIIILNRSCPKVANADRKVNAEFQLLESPSISGIYTEPSPAAHGVALILKPTI